MRIFARLLLIPVFLMLFCTLSIAANASEFKLTRIGALDTGGKTYSEWWYSGTFPTLYGTGAADTGVGVQIDSKEYSVRSDGSGNWSFFAPVDKGAYNIKLTQGSSLVSFKLHLGESLPSGLSSSSQSTQSSSSVPATGFDQIFALTFGAGVLLLSLYAFLSGCAGGNGRFEKQMLDK